MEEKVLQKKGYSIYLDIDLVRRLDAYAKSKPDQRLSPSWLINKWVDERLEEEEKK